MAARVVNSCITDIAPQQKWKWVRIHISLTHYIGGVRDGGLRKLREELEAENSGVHIPAQIRWLGGAKIRARFQANKDGSSSVVAAVLGEATYGRLCKSGVRLLGRRYEVDTFEEARRLDAFCSRCSGWKHIAPHCLAAAPKCALCARDHLMTDRDCPVEGCKVGKGHTGRPSARIAGGPMGRGLTPALPPVRQEVEVTTPTTQGRGGRGVSRG